MDDGVTSPRRSWWPFSSARPSNTSARDDGSVDYASLNEDWASRSQDDPLWWIEELRVSGALDCTMHMAKAFNVHVNEE
jgi:hypothetical protein